MSYPCPFHDCQEPMYNATWSKNKSCKLWKITEEERYCFFDYIEDAKSVKYETLSQPITDPILIEQHRIKIQSTIDAGKAFFEQMFTFENQFEPESNNPGFNFNFIYDDSEIYTGISVLFDNYEEEYVNLKSKDKAINSIIEFENNVIKVEQTENFQQSAKNIEATFSLEYINQKEIFFKNFDQFNKPFIFDQSSHINYINELLQFEESKLKISLSDLNFSIVYITSAGGKSKLAKKSKIYLDIDEFIARHSTKFKIVEEYCAKNEDYSLMTLYFKSTFYNDLKFLQGKILLINHPNQIPNQFRLGFNELVIIPKQQNWNTRWFNENYFTLISIGRKIKYYLEYDQYDTVIQNHFRSISKFKYKYIFDITGKFIKSENSKFK